MAKKKTADCWEVRASRIVLVDGSGNERIVLQLENDQPSITLFGLNHSVQVRLGVDAGNYNSAELLLASPNGNTLGLFSVLGNPNTEGVATLLFGGGSKRIVASTNLPTLLPTLDLIDEAGITVAHLPTSSHTAKETKKTKAGSKKSVASKANKKK